MSTKDLETYRGRKRQKKKELAKRSEARRRGEKVEPFSVTDNDRKKIQSLFFALLYNPHDEPVESIQELILVLTTLFLNTVVERIGYGISKYEAKNEVLDDLTAFADVYGYLGSLEDPSCGYFFWLDFNEHFGEFLVKYVRRDNVPESNNTLQIKRSLN